MSKLIDELIQRAKAAIDGSTEGPWTFQPWGGQNQNGDYAESILFDGSGETMVYGLPDNDGEFIADARTLVPELVAALERLKEAAKTLGKHLDASLMDVARATDSLDLLDEDRDGDWMLIFERLAELRPARDAALAEVERLRVGGPWVEHVERMEAMKRTRDGECICDTSPETGGPEEFCPWHGRPYSELLDIITRQQAEINGSSFT